MPRTLSSPCLPPLLCTSTYFRYLLGCFQASTKVLVDVRIDICFGAWYFVSDFSSVTHFFPEFCYPVSTDPLLGKPDGYLCSNRHVGLQNVIVCAKAVYLRVSSFCPDQPWEAFDYNINNSDGRCQWLNMCVTVARNEKWAPLDTHVQLSVC